MWYNSMREIRYGITGALGRKCCAANVHCIYLEIARLNDTWNAYLKEKAMHSHDDCDEGVQDDGWSSVRHTIFEEAVMGAASIDLPQCVCCQAKSVFGVYPVAVCAPAVTKGCTIRLSFCMTEWPLTENCL